MRHFVPKTRCLLFCLALCLSVNAATCLAQPHSPKDESQALFDFHSGFWINLHHFLYLEALSEKPQRGPHPAIVNKADAETLNSLSEEDRFLFILLRLAGSREDSHNNRLRWN